MVTNLYKNLFHFCPLDRVLVSITCVWIFFLQPRAALYLVLRLRYCVRGAGMHPLTPQSIFHVFEIANMSFIATPNRRHRHTIVYHSMLNILTAAGPAHINTHMHTPTNAYCIGKIISNFKKFSFSRFKWSKNDFDKLAL